LPRLPALPLIWMYSPEVIQRNPAPSNLRALVKTTVLAGMLRPVEKVSVANSACSSACAQSNHSMLVDNLLVSLSPERRTIWVLGSG